MENFDRKPKNKSLIFYEGSCENEKKRVIINARKNFSDMEVEQCFIMQKAK